MWNLLKKVFPNRVLSEEEFQQKKKSLIKQTPIPVIWLFGKTGSGKSSIIRYLTGVESIEIGTGFKPQTRFSARFDFPDASEPLLRFLDTRGLGEVNYDPREDLESFGTEAHLMIVVVRAMDHALDEVVQALRVIRREVPRRPVLLALTSLHDAFPGQQHPTPDPFDESERPLPEGISPGLRRSLELQYQRFDGLFDRAVPLDLTPVDEGFEQPHFGGQRLKHAIIAALPSAYRQTLLQLEEVVTPLKDLTRRRTMPVILGMSTMAASAAAIPIPWVDIPLVMGLQTHLAYRLAKIHHQPLDKRTIAKVSGSLGGSVAIRLAIRETLKFIPWVGIAANAAAAFAYTFATGMAWNWYFTRVKQGHMPTDAEIREVFQIQLTRAAELWKGTHAAAVSEPVVTSSAHEEVPTNSSSGTSVSGT